MVKIDYKEYIEVNPEIRFGKPVIIRNQDHRLRCFAMACLRDVL